MATVTKELLYAIAPNATASIVQGIIDNWHYAEEAGIDTDLRQAHFLAQLAHESGYFRYLKEIWGTTNAQKGYEGRKDLGNTQTGDGRRFAGHGLIQLTGRENHTLFNAWVKKNFPDSNVDFVADPEAAATFPWALVAAVYYWDWRNLNALADKDDVVSITKRINGGTNGLEDRKSALAKAKKAFASVTPTVTSPVVTTPAVTETVTVRPTISIRVNDENTTRLLQQGLKAKGYYGQNVDGKFGKYTESSLKAYQKSVGLVADGIAGKQTWIALGV